MSKKLNIIIPMYNAEAFIERTVLSIVQSNLPVDFYDILIVNDGSTDKSAEKVNNLRKYIPCIRLIIQENGGASKARNTGIENVESDYIWFVDSDDRVEKNLSMIPNIINNYPNLDVYLFKYNWINEQGVHVGYGSTQSSVTHNQIISGHDVILQGYTPGSVCGLLINRNYLKKTGIKFQEGMTHEDVVFTLELFAKARKVYFSDEVIYNYVFRTDSVTQPNSLNKLIKYNVDEAKVIPYFYKISQSLQNSDIILSQKIYEYANNTLFGCVYNLFRKRKEWKVLGVNKAVISYLKDNDLYPLKGPFETWKKRLASMFLNIECLVS